MDAKTAHSAGTRQSQQQQSQRQQHPEQLQQSEQLQQTPAKLLPGRQQALTQTRFLPAAPAVVFALWTESAQLLHWFAEPGFAVALCEGSVVDGGDWQLVLRDAQGRQFSIQRQYLQVDPPRRLHYCEQCSGSNGVFYAAMTVVTFEKLASKTKLTVRAEPDQAYDDAEIAEWQRGTSDLLDRLVNQLHARRATQSESPR